MSKRKFLIQGAVTGTGGEWAVLAEVEIEAQTAAEGRGELNSEIDKLFAMGFRPLSLTKPVKSVSSAGPTDTVDEPELAPPVCREHSRGMTKSKFREADGLERYYCSSKTPEGYCKHKAQIEPDGSIKYYQTRSK